MCVERVVPADLTELREVVRVDPEQAEAGVAVVLYLDNGWRVRIHLAEPGVDLSRYRMDGHRVQ
jgi:nitrogen fixation protein